MCVPYGSFIVCVCGGGENEELRWAAGQFVTGEDKEAWPCLVANKSRNKPGI